MRTLPFQPSFRFRSCLHSSPLESLVTRRFPSVQAALHSTSIQRSSRRYAILGAGFAGLSVAWHLLQHSSEYLQISVEVFDGEGLGAGASGASGGLLHPYTPKGKLVWSGIEGWHAALELLSVAETVDKLEASGTEGRKNPIAWRRGIVRPPASKKHCNDFMKFVKLSSGEHRDLAGLSCLNGNLANALLPGLAVADEDFVLHISEGLNIDPVRYLQALWKACELEAELNSKRYGHSYAVLKKSYIDSLSLFADRYDGVIVCMGAGVSKLPELTGKLPMTYCRGLVARLALPSDKSGNYKFDGPSIVGDTWISAQGPNNLILGATKEWDDCNLSSTVDDETASAAYNKLCGKAATFYPPIRNWLLENVRAGVRAMTPRTSLGKIPLVGCIDEIVNLDTSSSPYYWIFGGLGSRGLIYHAWLGKLIAQAVVSQNERCLPNPLLEWKSHRIGVGALG